MRRLYFVRFLWVPLWTKCNMRDGLTEHFCIYDRQVRKDGPFFFDTKNACQAYITEKWGYIARRDDLRREPHCWRVPKPVKVIVQIGELHARKLPRRYRRTRDARKRRTSKG